MGLNKRDIRDKKEEYLPFGHRVADIYFGRVLFGIGLVSNRSTFKYPSTFLPPGVPTPFLPCTATTELPTESFQANRARSPP